MLNLWFGVCFQICIDSKQKTIYRFLSSKNVELNKIKTDYRVLNQLFAQHISVYNSQFSNRKPPLAQSNVKVKWNNNKFIVHQKQKNKKQSKTPNHFASTLHAMTCHLIDKQNNWTFTNLLMYLFCRQRTNAPLYATCRTH